MLIKHTIIIILGLALLACNPAGTSTNNNIRPSQSTNDVALSNLDLGMAYMKQGSFEKALEKLNRAKEADPNYSSTYNVLGLLYETLGENIKAEENFTKAIRLNSNDSKTLNNYGLFLCNQGRKDEAETVFAKAANNPLYESPELAIANAGVCFYDNNEIPKAEDYFRRALKLNSKLPSALLLMAEITFRQQDVLNARGYLQRYQEVSSLTAKSLWLGIQIEQQLDNKNAVSSYSLLLKNKFPDSVEAARLREAGIR